MQSDPHHGFDDAIAATKQDWEATVSTSGADFMGARFHHLLGLRFVLDFDVVLSGVRIRAKRSNVNCLLAGAPPHTTPRSGYAMVASSARANQLLKERPRAFLMGLPGSRHPAVARRSISEKRETMGIAIIFAVSAIFGIGGLISFHLGRRPPGNWPTDTESGSGFDDNHPGQMHHSNIGLDDTGTIEHSTVSLLSTHSTDPFPAFATINPANGLPMIGGMGGMDLGGNAYGMSHDIFESSTSDTPFRSCSSFDDSFSSSFSDSFSSSRDSFGSSFDCGSDW